MKEFVPDDVYCRLLNVFEKVEKAGPNNNNGVGYEYIDYNLEEPKLLMVTLRFGMQILSVGEHRS